MADQPRGRFHTLRQAIANAAEGLARRVGPAGADHAHPLSANATGKTQQQLNAQSAYQKSRLSNEQPFNRPANLPLMGRPAAKNIPGVVPDKIQDLMQQNKAPQETEVPMYAPGAPLMTVPELESPEGPRGWQYPVGTNISSLPRSTESTSYSQLRNLALLYEGIQLCETVYFDILSRLVPVLHFKPNVVPIGESGEEPKWRKIIDPAEQFLRYPDGEHTLHAWLTASARDVLELGWSSIYKQRDRAGRIMSLDLIDAATIKPLVDQRGRRPHAPFPAYAQYLYGVPAGRYLADEICMIQESARSDSVYPLSRVERIIMRINMALRKESLDLSRFTDGSIPEGMIFPDSHLNWNPAQIEDYERVFNGLLAGNDRYRVRVKFGPPGAKFVNTRPSDPMMEFDSYLLNVCVAVFGLTMDEIAMTQDSNRSVGQTQQDVIYRRVIEPLANRYAQFLTEVIQQTFDDRLIVTWGGIEEIQDQLVKAQMLNLAVQAGALAPNRMAEMLGFPVDVKTPPFVVTKEGLVFLDDALATRASKNAAEIAQNEFTAKQPDATMPGGGRPPQDEEPHADKTPKGKSAPDQADKADKADKPDRAVEPKPLPGPAPASRIDGEVRKELIAEIVREITMGSGFVGYDLHAPVQVTQPTEASCNCGPKCSCEAAGKRCDCPPDCTCGQPSKSERSAEYRRWRKVAMNAIDQGKRVPPFKTDLIDLEDYALLSMALAHCRTIDDVRAAFNVAREREAQTA